MIKQIGAVVGAVALVVGAFVIRGAVSGGSDGIDDPGGGGDRAGGLVCPTEFAALCDTTGEPVRTATAGATADALLDATSADALDGDAWIVPRAWAELVIAERSRLGRPALFAVDESPIASSPVVAAVWGAPATELETVCGVVDWTCLATEARVGGNRLQVGMPDVDSATGLTVAAAQAASLLGTTDYASNDFAGAFRGQATRLSANQSRTPLTTMRTRGPGQLTAVGVVAADATNLSSNFGTIAPLTTEPSVSATVVALVRAGDSLDGSTRRALGDAFTDAGWQAGAASADAPDGLPAGGVLAALRELWNS